MKANSIRFALTLTLFAGFNAYAHEGHGIPGALPPGPHGGVVAESETGGGHGHDHGDAKDHGHDHGGDRNHMHDHGSDAKGKPHAHQPAAGEKEYFFEAVYKDGKVTIYPLTLGAGATAFVSVPGTSFKNVILKAEVPRKKSAEVLKTTVTSEGIEAKFDSKKANRFILHLSAELEGSKRIAKLQIEKNK